MFKYSYTVSSIPAPASSDVSNRERAEFKPADTEYRHTPLSYKLKNSIHTNLILTITQTLTRKTIDNF